MRIELNTVGADPEFFIKRSKDGTFMPSAVVTGGTKTNPEETGKDGFFIHKDNLTIEGSIPPAKSKEEFVASMKFLKGIINTIATTKGCELVCEDQVKFAPRFLRLSDADDFGCSGYKNAWSRIRSEISTPHLTSDQRVAGFHIHLGYKKLDGRYSKSYFDKAIARAFDLFVTFPSDEIKYSNYRRTTYGKYGSYREKSYGVECRALGGYFAKDEYLGVIYDQAVKMFDWLNTGDNIEKILSKHYYGVNSYAVEDIKERFKIKEALECTV